MRQGGLDWRATLRGSCAAGEELWLVAVDGSKAALADGALASAGDIANGEARLLDLVAEAGA